jgi:hypothetical protein
MYYTYVRNRKKYKGRECMDFANRNSQQPAVPRPEGSTVGASAGKKNKKLKIATAGLVSLLFAGTILVVALVLLFSVGSNNANPGKYVNNKDLQAVFLNNGQVYFGNIKTINSKYIDLTNIYYLRTDSTSTTAAASSANNISLVKLGCELHGPTDEMLINVQQLTFWEKQSLRTSSKIQMVKTVLPQAQALVHRQHQQPPLLPTTVARLLPQSRKQTNLTHQTPLEKSRGVLLFTIVTIRTR